METKNKIAISEILSTILSNDKIPKHLKKRLTNDLIWSATEDSDDGERVKYKIKYWSPKAIDKFNKTMSTDGLVHEHIYPKSLIRKKILESNQSQKDIESILNEYCHAAIITKEEDRIIDGKGYRQKLPIPKEGYNSQVDELFSRYVEAEIEIVEAKFNDTKLIEKGDYILKKENDKIQIKIEEM